MSSSTRRRFLKISASAATAATLFARRDKPLRIGITDWNLNLGADPAAVPLAKNLSFDGVQISFGRQLVNGKLPVDNPETLARYTALSRENSIPIDGTCVDRLHDNGLKSDPLAPRWVSDSIRMTKQLGVEVLLLPFFGKWALETQTEKDNTAAALRELAPEAEKAGVILGLENTISAEDNLRILEKVSSNNVLVYYDVGNSTKAGFDPVREIRFLGKKNICQIHLKDNPNFLGEGSIPFPQIIHAIREIGFTGFANLETDAHPETLEADLRRNLIYIRNVIAKS